MIVREHIEDEEEEHFSKNKTLKNKFPSHNEESDRIKKFHSKFNSKTTQHRRRILVSQIKEEVLKKKRIPETTLDYYQISKLLGEGSYAKVYLGTSILTQKQVAVKCYDFLKLKMDKNQDRLIFEIELLHDLDHQNVIKILEIFQNKKYIFMVMEYMDSGDILGSIKKYGKYEETDYFPIIE